MSLLWVAIPVALLLGLAATGVSPPPNILHPCLALIDDGTGEPQQWCPNGEPSPPVNRYHVFTDDTSWASSPQDFLGAQFDVSGANIELTLPSEGNVFVSALQESPCEVIVSKNGNPQYGIVCTIAFQRAGYNVPTIEIVPNPQGGGEVVANYQGGYAETPWENGHVRFIFRVWEESDPGYFYVNHNDSRPLTVNQTYQVFPDNPTPFHVECPGNYIARGRILTPDGFEMAAQAEAQC